MVAASTGDSMISALLKLTTATVKKSINDTTMAAAAADDDCRCDITTAEMDNLQQLQITSSMKQFQH